MDANVEPVIGREVRIISATHPHSGESGVVTEYIAGTGQWVVDVANTCEHGVQNVAALPDEIQFTQAIPQTNQTDKDTTQQSSEIETLNVKSNEVPKKRGGARPGAGRPKGRLDDKTIDRLKVQKAAIDRIHINADKLLNAAMNKALGETYLMRKVTERDTKGKVLRVYHEIVTDPQTIIEYLDSEQDGAFGDEDEWYYMTTKPADIMAFKDLYDRAFGKPAQTVNADITSKGERLNEPLTSTQAEQLLRLRASRGNSGA